LHILTRRDLHDLFDTAPDLSGADIDISRFVREGEERDVTVWWWPIPERQDPHRRLRPSHDALCRIPVGDARKWLVPGVGRGDDEGAPTEESKARPRAWVWSYLDGDWEPLEKRHIYPGQTILVDAGAGGYDLTVGFTGKDGTVPVERAHVSTIGASDAADAADEQDELSEGLGDARRQYKTIATHGAETAAGARSIATAVGLEPDSREAMALELSALAHDIGKAHLAFAAAVSDRNGIGADVPLAKAPTGRWHAIRDMYDHSSLGKRPGFRHELASALALLELMWRARPDHPGLQGGHEEVLERTVGRDLPEDDDRIAQPPGLIARLVDLDESTLNLVLYLVMSHHGKVRAALTMSPRDQDNPDAEGTLPIRGVRDGDVLPALVLVDGGGSEFQLPQVRLHLDPAKLGLSRRYGPSWVERVLALRERYGGFQLAWCEALLRVADVRASKIARPRDLRLPQDLVEVSAVLETEDRDAQLRQWIEETLAAVTGDDEGSGRRGRRRDSPARSSRTSAGESQRGSA
jgi:CRISPR-associated endonuclease/helicase Cas3